MHIFYIIDVSAHLYNTFFTVLYCMYEYSKKLFLNSSFSSIIHAALRFIILKRLASRKSFIFFHFCSVHSRSLHLKAGSKKSSALATQHALILLPFLHMTGSKNSHCSRFCSQFCKDPRKFVCFFGLTENRHRT